MAGYFHCDGGALFGVIPKILWSKVYPADENNFTRLAIRCLLVDQGKRKILIETGIGNHYSDKYLQINGVASGNHLQESLINNGYTPEDITDVLLTHLHWDHASGSVRNNQGILELVYPNAAIWCSKRQWEHAFISNLREKAAYHTEVLNFLGNSGKIRMIESTGEILPGIRVQFFDGHTPGQIIPFIQNGLSTIVYTSDLIPTSAHIPLLWIAAYDLFPVTVMKEKQDFLKEAFLKKYILFFEHDFYTECTLVDENEKGFAAGEKNSLSFFLHNPAESL